MKYSIAYNFDRNLIKFYKLINKKKDFVFEVFLSSSQGYLGGARYYDLPHKSFRETKRHIDFLKKNKIKINYLVNSSFCPELRNKEEELKLNNYFLWIDSQKPDIVTIANKKILRYVSKNFPNLKINISIVMGIKTIKQVNELRAKYPNIKRVTLHQSVNRDRDLLIRHVKNAKKTFKTMEPIEIELLANEICLYKCPKMKQHYLYNSIKSFQGSVKHENIFEAYCKKVRESNPLHFLNSTFIRPEDVHFYEKIGIDILKLSGREAPSKYLKLVSNAYISKSYSGNVMDIFDSRYWINNKPPFIDNKKLNEFLKYLWDNKSKMLKSIPQKYKSFWGYQKNRI